MADKPIIFSGPMIRAVLAGRKTMTRRVLKPQPEPCGGKILGAIYHNDFYWPVGPGHGVVSCKPFPPADYLEAHPLPYQPGDRLWVRETFLRADHPSGPGFEEIYRADNTGHAGPWRSPIHMPRWASRLTLPVREVRVERLQEITAEDAIAEGIDPAPHRCGCERCAMTAELCPATASGLIEEFAHLWDSLHKPGNRWADNPWVAVVRFEPRRCNIDASEARAG